MSPPAGRVPAAFPEVECPDDGIQMTTLRRRVGPFLQWGAAVGFLAAAIWVGTGLVRTFREVTSDEAVAADRPAPAPPATLPSGAVSLPVLFFEDGKGVRVGDTASHIAALLGRGAEVGRQELDDGGHGERLTRFYEYGGRQFALFFALDGSHEDPRVEAIFLY